MAPWRWGIWARRVILIGAAAGLVGAGVWLFMQPTTVTIASASVRDIAPAVQGVGTVEAKVVLRIAPKITGRLMAVLVDQGDGVRAGEVLARLDPAELAAQLQQAEASVQRARLAVGTQEVALRKGRVVVQVAEAAVGRLRATEGLARANAERWRQLHTEGGVSRMELDARTTEAVVAAEEAQSAIAQRQAAAEELGTMQATLEMLRQEVRVAEAALAAAQARAGDTEIRSPLDGVVVSRELEAGAAVSPGSAILKVADLRTAWVTVHLDEREVAGIGVGDRAEITLRSLPGRRLPGRVARIQRESDRVTEELAVDIAFEERPLRLTLGEQAEAAIRPAGRVRVTAIPLASVVRTAEGAGAWVVADGRMHFRPLRLGAVDPAGWVEVVDGITPGAALVVAPGRLAQRSNEGRRVAVARITAGGETLALRGER